MEGKETRRYGGARRLSSAAPASYPSGGMKRSAAFFDLDKTIIAKSSVLAFSRPFYREGLLSKRAIVRSIYAQIVYMLVGADEAKMEKIREAMLALTRGWDRAHVASIVRETLDDVVSPIIFAEAVELMDEHRAAGRDVVIVSSSPMEVVEPLAAFLGVDHAIGTRARVDDDGLYTGELDFYAYGPYKVEAMKQLARDAGLDLSESYAYSDSVTDAPMLETVGHPVAVNPDRDLARLAAERGWEVRRFERPVRLRERVTPPPPATAVAGAVVAAAGAGAVAYWWVRRRDCAGASRTRAARRPIVRRASDALGSGRAAASRALAAAEAGGAALGNTAEAVRHLVRAGAALASPR